MAHEIRMAGLLAGGDSVHLPPVDGDAEQTVVGALLETHARPSDLAPLTAEHFYGLFAREVFAAATELERRGSVIDVETVATELHARGVRGPLSEELIHLRDWQPFCLLEHVRQSAARIIELHRQRQLIAQMQRVDADLRLGAIDTDQARARLREVIG